MADYIEHLCTDSVVDMLEVWLSSLASGTAVNKTMCGALPTRVLTFQIQPMS